MSEGQSRLRMFAGPNGSGKSTLKEVINPQLLGYYINADEVELYLKDGALDCSRFGLNADLADLMTFLEESVLLREKGQIGQLNEINIEGSRISLDKNSVNSYFAAVLADYLRQSLLANHRSFSFETVMSSRDKIDILRKAQQNGYRTYLYFVATEDPDINISRVRNRVTQGGHDVPVDKIVSRYFKSLDNLLDAIRYSNRAYLFDNSSDGRQRSWIAEVYDGQLETKTTTLPHWFKKFVLDKLG